ncbi:MAG: hypothetical protein BGO14_07275 [Chlamydiales bacterium 38-26]|nr:hypothetical protein [Chlamydiales bacterium]OJV10805.1 MAG: hypothetical protein BGO14_07275 [Chlamydiales bacterium 38-26]
MKINNKILSIPPYISTSWNYVKSLQTKGPFLVITLMGGESINIPNLKGDLIEQIFNAHADYLEKNQENISQPQPSPFLNPTSSLESVDMPFRLGIGSIDGMGNPLVHNSAQKDAPDIPKPILEKIAAIAKIISPEELSSMPKAEPHCNCLHCQIVRTINSVVEPETPQHDEHELDVKDEDLIFQQWAVSQAGDKLFNVINKLDTQEKYSVYLGHPLGCTCGKSSCAHIEAVLRS